MDSKMLSRRVLGLRDEKVWWPTNIGCTWPTVYMRVKCEHVHVPIPASAIVVSVSLLHLESASAVSATLRHAVHTGLPLCMCEG